jgi:hypothetical protein
MIGHCLMQGRLAALRLARQFARTVKPQKPNFKERVNSRVEIKSKEDTRLLKEEDRLKPDDPDITEHSLAKMHLKTQIMPEK